MIVLARIYDQQKKKKEVRVLIDRIWPRGIRKSDAGLTAWYRDLAPSSALRKWFEHDPAKFERFKLKYKHELSQKKEQLAQIKDLEEMYGTIVLLYAARDNVYNNAVVLKEVLDSL